MICPQCGAKFLDGSKICVNCGYSLTGQNEQTTPQQHSRGTQPLQQSTPKRPLSYLRIVGLIVGLIGAFFLLIGVFLPYASVISYKQSLLEIKFELIIDGMSDATLFLILAFLGIVFSILSIGIGQIIVGLASFGIWANEYVYLDNSIKSFLSTGFYFIVIGALVMIIGGICCMASRITKKE